MTREHKLSLLLGFAAVLVVGILISDHFSGASRAQLDSVDPSNSLGVDLSSEPDTGSQLALVGSDGIDHTPPSPRPAGPDQQLAPAGDLSGSTRLADDAIDFISNEMRELGIGHVAAQTTDLNPGVPTIDMSQGLRESRTRPAVDLASMPEFTLHRVRPGDSLWSLAQQHLGDGSRHPEIASINEDRLGKGGTLRVGASIRIPVASSGSIPVAAQEDSPPGGTAEQAKDTPAAARTYTVKKGDTLSEIAQELLGTMRRQNEILEANESVLDSADDLKVGMKLQIPPR